MISPATAPVGTVAFDVHNDGDFVHDFSILGRTTPPLKSGESATLTVNFTQPGSYTYNSTRDEFDREMWGVFTVTGTAATTTAPPLDLPLRHVLTTLARRELTLRLPDGRPEAEAPLPRASRRRRHLRRLA
jgi:hypothetical protein